MDKQNFYKKVGRLFGFLTLFSFISGFIFGSSLEQKENLVFSPQDLRGVENRFVARELMDIRQASLSSIRQAKLKMRSRQQEDSNTYFAPLFGKHFWTHRGWAQRITCLSSPDFVRPLRTTMTSRYGKRKNPFGHYTKLHSGLDYRGVIGTPIPVSYTHLTLSTTPYV